MTKQKTPENARAADAQLIEEAGKLFSLYKQLHELEEAKARANGGSIDINVFTLAMTQSNPKFAHSWPIVIKTMAIRGQFFTKALVAYLSYVRGVTLDKLSEQHLERLDSKVKSSRLAKEAYERAKANTPQEIITTREEFDIDIAEVQRRREAGELIEPTRVETIVTNPAAELTPPPDYKPDKPTLLEARLRAKAEIEAYYVYLTLREDAKAKRPHNWASLVPNSIRNQLEVEVYQELQATEQQNAEAVRMSQEIEARVLEERREHLLKWLKRANAQPSFAEDFEGLTKPSAHATGALGCVTEYRQQFVDGS